MEHTVAVYVESHFTAPKNVHMPNAYIQRNDEKISVLLKAFHKCSNTEKQQFSSVRPSVIENFYCKQELLVIPDYGTGASVFHLSCYRPHS